MQVSQSRTETYRIPRCFGVKGMRTTQPSSPRMAKSTSLAVLEHEHDMHIVDQDDIIGLTQDVKNFSDGLAKLKAVGTEEYDCEEDMKVVAHERLGDVLCTLKSVLQRYPPLNTTELFSAAATLIGKIKSYNYEDHSTESMENAFSDAIDQLALEFSSSVSEYLMGGDLHHGVLEEVKTKSYDNLMSVSQETTDKEETTEDEKEEIVRLTPEQIDATLMTLQAGLELAFQRAKAWSKYLKDVMSYIERRAQLEVEYSKNLSRLAASVKPQLTEEGFLPLQSVYCTVLSQDVEYAKTCQATFTMLQTTKFVEPLTARKNEHDKVRKTLKENWNKEVKRMHEAVNNLKKAQSMYVTRQQEYEKARELSQKTESEMLTQSGGLGNMSGKIDKRKKAEDDASHKAAEAETTYKACVAEANNRQTDVQRVKSDLLAAIREQIFFSDQAIRKVTIEYFQLLQTVSAPVPVQYHTLCEASKRYESGSQYGEFVRRLPTSSAPVDFEEYKFEPYHVVSSKGDVGTRKTSTQSNESATSDHHSQEGSPNLSSPRRDKYRVPVKAWGQQGLVLNSDTDSQSGSSKSLDSSPSSSPYPVGHKKMALTGSMEDVIEDTSGVKRLLAVPGTEQLTVQSIVKRQGRRNTTFGVDFQEQVEHYHSAVPPIISKSLKEVEKRGIDVKGIYRVSGVKSTVENLCQRFEMDPESINLSQENPNVISNVLKLYLRQLPEPLLTFKQYPSFIGVAKENMSGSCTKEATVEKLHNLIDQLPYSNRKTLGVLMHHLHRVSEHVEQNQMNASNLGIVFGPTLLRPQGGNASLAALVDTPHQTRVVELLIVSAVSLFGPSEDHQLIPGETMVEHLEKKNTLIVPSQATIELPKDTRTEPKKETVPSPSLTLPKEHLLPPNVPQSSSGKESKESSPKKKSGDDISLPGSTHFDKRDLSHKSSSSSQLTTHLSPEGEDFDIENGLTNENSAGNDLANENSAESDIQSDDDLILPDDSQRFTHQPDIKTISEECILTNRNMISPAIARKSRLPSPSSSPNLSSRSCYSSPPAIRVDNSILSDPSDSSSSLSPPSKQKVYQLPPVNSWVPKGESLFTSILDSRSPQVYRRTHVAAKTASFPQSTQSPVSPSSRVSWPQGSQLQLTQEIISTPELQKSQNLDVEMDESIGEKSPRLLKKCTSFDLERSRPFPNRSSMTSPMLLRKGLSIDETDGEAVSFVLSDSPTITRKADHGPDCSNVTGHKQTVGGDIMIDVPHCVSTGNLTTPQDKPLTTVSVQQVELVTVGLNDADSHSYTTDAKIIQSNILSDETNRNGGRKSKETVVKKDSKIVDTGAKPKRKKTTDTETNKTTTGEETVKQTVKQTVKKKESSNVGREGSKQSSPVMKGKSLLKNTKKDNSTSYSVKSALMSSAAKLKSLGKRSPVTLLSYKSHSMTIPDQTSKSRPSSMSSISGSPTKKMVHQCESSPTVLQNITDLSSLDENSKVKRSATGDFGLSEDTSDGASSSPPVKRAVSPTGPVKRAVSPTGPVKQAVSPTGPDKRPVSPTGPVKRAVSPTGPVKRAVSPTGPVKRAVSPTGPVKPTQSHSVPAASKRSIFKSTSSSSSQEKSKIKEKLPSISKPRKSLVTQSTTQSREKPTSSSSSVSTRPSSSIVSSRQQKTNTKPSLSHTRKGTATVKGATASTKDEVGKTAEEDKRRAKFPKRDSISSIQSDTSRKSDHVHDCCSCKKSTAEKKPNYLHSRKRISEKK